jgi:SSS family transporter
VERGYFVLERNGLTVIDGIICIGYFLAITGLGAFFYRSQKSTKDFFLAGRSMGWLPVGLSLMATLTSGIGYIGSPAGSVEYGILTIWGLLAIPLSFPVVVWVFMPFYHRLNLYTAYEYLERRFDVSVRTLTSGIFIVWRITWMATAIYVPSMVLNIVTDGALPLIPSVLVLGTLATVYTALGGIKAVMWTDVAQFAIMFGGMIVAAVLIFSRVPGGFPEVWDTLDSQGKTSLTAAMEGWKGSPIWEKMRLYLFTDVTALAVIISATVGKLGNYCVDQVMVQRYLTARSLKTSQGAFLCNCFAYCFYILSMTVIGASLIAYAHHYAFPETLRNDQVFPYFIANAMPVGVAGLMVASIYAASMSSLDSGVNSCITAITNDFYNRLWMKRASLEDLSITEEEQRRQLAVARWASFVLGIIVTILACYVGKMGDVFMIANKLINGFIGPLFGIFMLAMFTRRAHSVPVLIGGLVGTGITGIMIFAEKIGLERFDIGFMWPSTLGTVVTFVLGYLLSVVMPRPKNDGARWTFRGVMERESEPR